MLLHYLPTIRKEQSSHHDCHYNMVTIIKEVKETSVEKRAKLSRKGRRMEGREEMGVRG